MIKDFENLGEFEKDFRKCWLYCVWHLLMTERCKKELKTDYENLVHVYLKGKGLIVKGGGLQGRDSEFMW
jgi:hypothetical protein